MNETGKMACEERGQCTNGLEDRQTDRLPMNGHVYRSVYKRIRRQTDRLPMNGNVYRSLYKRNRRQTDRLPMNGHVYRSLYKRNRRQTDRLPMNGNVDQLVVIINSSYTNTSLHNWRRQTLSPRKCSHIRSPQVSSSEFLYTAQVLSWMTRSWAVFVSMFQTYSDHRLNEHNQHDHNQPIQ